MGGGCWGMFEVHNDTIVTESFYLGNANSSACGIRETLMVKSPDTLVLLASNIFPPDERHWAQTDKLKPGSDFYFVPFDQLPDSNKAWIKRKKWFWCDEEEWRQYKKARRKMYWN